MRLRTEDIHVFRLLAAVFLVLVALSCDAEESVQLPVRPITDLASASKILPQIARTVGRRYDERDPITRLDNKFRLQLAASQFASAAASLGALDGLLKSKPQVRAARIPYLIFARAKLIQRRNHLAFRAALETAFRDTFSKMGDETSARVIRALSSDQSTLKDEIQTLLRRLTGKTAIPLSDALLLVRQMQTLEVYDAFAPLLSALVAEDDGRRYIVERDVLVPTTDGASVCVLIVRPRHAQGRLPALLDFTIYNVPQFAVNLTRRTASNGYVAVEGLVRGKACSAGDPVPYEHDSADAAALIEWISHQPWSDGRVGMWGGSYSGFTQWAAAKRLPTALKAMMPMAPGAPGIDTPMDGNIFMNFIYPWPFYTTDNKTVDNTVYNDRARWDRLYRSWYVSGRAYRDLDKIDGTPNPIFDKWLEHPNYDSYWQSMIPYRSEFSRIDIPVLTTMGYFFGGPGAGLYYFTEHYKYDAGAEHYMLIGPYDHFQAQRGLINELGEPETLINYGLTLDPVALIDVGDLRYQWFNYVLKGGAKPTLLQDKVNYELVGANEWRHAQSIADMSNAVWRLYLTSNQHEGRYVLSDGPPPTPERVTLKVDLADRSDADRTPPGGGIESDAIDTANSIALVSEPLPHPTEVSGLLSGNLEFLSSKPDFDFQIALYELTSGNKYVLLTTYQSRASYVHGLAERNLIVPGRRQSMAFTATRLSGRLTHSGSRLVLTLGVVKDPSNEINYGTGGLVADETVQNAGAPLTIDWLDGTFFDVPLHK